MRDDFDRSVKETLARRVGDRCSNPDCGRILSGPHTDPTKFVNLGIAAHITAASPKGPRYDPSLTPTQRSDIANGIFLCQNCAKLIDNDPAKYPVSLLLEWKSCAEEEVFNALSKLYSNHNEGQLTISILVLSFDSLKKISGRLKLMLSSNRYRSNLSLYKA